MDLIMNDNGSELGSWLVRMAKVESKIELGVSANSAPPIEGQVLSFKFINL